jgi:hypothetical protein
MDTRRAVMSGAGPNGGGRPPRALRAAQDPDGVIATFASRYEPVDWHAAFAAQPEHTDWLYREWLERGTGNALFAKPGTGKSLLALEATADLVRAGRTVMYLDDENRVTDLVERLQAFGCQPQDLDRLRLYSFAGLPPLDSREGGWHLSDLAERDRPDLVVIDTTTRMVAGRENDADTFLDLYRWSLAPLKGLGITVLRLDHPGKDEDRGQRGSSAKDGDVDTTWRMTTIIDGLLYRLTRIKGRAGHHGPSAFQLRRQFGPLRHEWSEAQGSAAGDDDKLVRILSACEAAGLPPDAVRTAVRKAMRDAGVTAPNTLVSQAMTVRQARSANGPDRADRADQGGRSAGPPPIGGPADRARTPALTGQPEREGTR